MLYYLFVAEVHCVLNVSFGQDAFSIILCYLAQWYLSLLIFHFDLLLSPFGC